MHVTYRPKPGKANELEVLVLKHWPTLYKLGLTTNQPPQVWRAIDKDSGQVYFVEVFQWKDETSSQSAHQSPGVMAIWETMGPILEKLELAQLDSINP